MPRKSVIIEQEMTTLLIPPRSLRNTLTPKRPRISGVVHSVIYRKILLLALCIIHFHRSRFLPPMKYVSEIDSLSRRLMFSGMTPCILVKRYQCWFGLPLCAFICSDLGADM
jgi:hypothetical protein